MYYLSYSRGEIANCPHRYNALYNKGQYKNISSLPLRTGQFKHKFSQEYVNLCVKNKQDSSIADMEKVFQEYWPVYNIPEDYYHEIYNECLEFAERNANYSSVIATEKKIMINFNPIKKDVEIETVLTKDFDINNKEIHVESTKSFPDETTNCFLCFENNGKKEYIGYLEKTENSFKVIRSFCEHSYKKGMNIKLEFGMFYYAIVDVLRKYYFDGIPLKDNDEILSIGDYKNTAYMPRQQELTKQLRYYTFAVYHSFPSYEYYMRYIYYLKYNRSKCYEIDQDNPTPLLDIQDEVEDTRKMLIRDYKKIHMSKEFPSVVGEWCYTFLGCKILLDGKCPKIVDPKEKLDMNKKVRSIYQLNTILKDLKKSVKEYVDQNGNIEVDGMEIGYNPDDSDLYYFEDGYEFCHKIGLDLDSEKFPSAIIGKAKKIIKDKFDGKNLKDELEEIRNIIPGTKFTTY